jgi:hypothetical protein
MMEDEGAIFLVQVLVKPHSLAGTPERALKQRLPLDQRFTPHVGPVKLDQVEGPHEHVLVSVPSSDQFKTGDPVVTAGDGLAIDDARAGA